MTCSLVPTEGGSAPSSVGASLAGTLVSSLHRLKDTDNHDGAFFVWGDMSIKIEGVFRLQFNLYEMRNMECFYIRSVVSDPFPVLPQKTWLGMSESTFLTRSFNDQGIRLRVRKEPRSLLRKRGPASEDYIPRHYKTHGRKQSKGERTFEYHESQSPGLSTHSQGSQEEASGSMQPHSFDSYPGYAYTPAGPFNSFPQELSMKRPRTNSEHSQPPNFGQQQQPLNSPHSPYQPRMYSDAQHNYLYGGQPSPQQPPFGYPYAPSPVATSSQGQSFTQRFSTQHGVNSNYNDSMLSSSGPAFFQSQPQYQQPQHLQAQFGGPEMMTSTAPQKDTGGFGGLDVVQRSEQISPGYGGLSMTAPRIYATPSGNRSDGYQMYPHHGQNISDDNMGDNMVPRTTSGAMYTTGATGATEGLGGSFQ